jgi:hypothetical protein
MKNNYSAGDAVGLDGPIAPVIRRFDGVRNAGKKGGRRNAVLAKWHQADRRAAEGTMERSHVGHAGASGVAE